MVPGSSPGRGADIYKIPLEWYFVSYREKELSMSECKIINSVFLGHQLETTGIEISVGVGRVIGSATKVIRIGLPMISILTAESTPQIAKIDPGAEDAFLAAADTLLKGGTEFYTVLRPDWALAALSWKAVPTYA